MVPLSGMLEQPHEGAYRQKEYRVTVTLRRSGYGIRIVLAGGAVIVLLIGIYIELMRRTNRVKAQPDVRADETGLTTWGYFRDQPLTLPWQRIAAWTLIPPTKPSGNIHYVVFGDGLRLTWVEPSYGPYGWSGVWSTSLSAYKKRAEQLHALIVARTGQPLRELRLDAGPAQQSANR